MAPHDPSGSTHRAAVPGRPGEHTAPPCPRSLTAKETSTMTTPTIKPAAVTALEDLAAALRAGRERTLGHPLAGDEEEIFALQLQGIVHLVAALDREVQECVL